MIAFTIDLVYTALLIYRFYCNSRVKGIVLLSVSTSFWIIIWIIEATPADIKFLFGVLPIIADNICLFLMFNDNQKLYNKVCRCICCGLGSKYEAIQAHDQDMEDM